MVDAQESIKQYVRLANYLVVAQIYLQDNFLLTRPLTFDDIKPRLLGHWGTSPGINFIYAQLNYLISKHNCSMLFVLGPGHGFPALQANLFLERSLEQFYPQASLNSAGVAYLCKNFSWPHGFPSHTNPMTPGSIVEGGELGYALATAYGAVLDNPDLIVPCVIGDGEAETGPTATAWHLNKFIDPRTNGVVLPIIHCNGYKIGGPTIYGRMAHSDLENLFNGYGYMPIFVEGNDLYSSMADALERAYQIIRTLQNEYRSGQRTGFAHFPMIIVKSPKGWSTIKEWEGKKIEGNNLAHQVVLPTVKTDSKALEALQNWLDSYAIQDLFDPVKGIAPSIQAIIPKNSMRMGCNIHAYSGMIYKPLHLPEITNYGHAIERGQLGSKSMHSAGEYLKDTFKLNNKALNFRLFSPDEISSNKLDAVLQATPRAFMLPLEPWDQNFAPNGCVIEMLSEHSLQGLAQGYVLTGRHAVFASYEAFLDIISSMTAQYIKFIKVARTCSWRGTYSSLNYILTSSGWRQDHNGFSHQNPGFVSAILQKQADFVKVYYPPDDNATLVALQECLQATNGVNALVAGKTDEPHWLSLQEAQEEIKRGIKIWDFASAPDPEIVFVGIGDYLTKETMAAIDIFTSLLPEIPVRCVNIMVLTGAGIGNGEPLSHDELEYYCTADKPVIFAYHGYPQDLKAMLFNYANNQRFTVLGYREEGSTTTPFDMHVLNGTSRYHIVLHALKLLKARTIVTQEVYEKITTIITEKLQDTTRYIEQFGIDPKEIAQWQWQRPI